MLSGHVRLQPSYCHHNLKKIEVYVVVIEPVLYTRTRAHVHSRTRTLTQAVLRKMILEQQTIIEVRSRRRKIDTLKVFS